MARKVRIRPVLGWREWVLFPELGLSVKAKVDTGAASSALHAYDIEPFVRDGARFVRFKVHPVQRETHTTVATEAPLVDERRVRSSGGHVTTRPVIETSIQIFDQTWPIEISLIRRDVMGFRMLLGRQAIRRRFLVDPGRSYLLGAVPVVGAKARKEKRT